MAKILTFDNPTTKDLRENPIKFAWEYFQGLDRFLQATITVFILLILATPFIITNYQMFTQHAAGSYTVPSTIDSTGATDASVALNNWLATVPDGSTIVFPAGGIYRMDVGLQFANRNNLTFEGNGATLEDGPSSSGADQLTSLFALGHTYGGFWGGTNNNITISNFTLIGNNPNPGVFTPGTEGQSGFEIDNSNNVTINNVTIKNVWSDGFKTGDVSGVHIYDNTVTNAGRNDVSIISGSNIEIDHNNFNESGYLTFDIEPNTSTESTTYVNYHDNSIGTWAQEFFALDGSHTGAVINNITVNNNSVSGSSLRAIVNNGNTTRNQTIVFTNNTSGVSAAGPVLQFAYIDGLTVYGNTQPLSSGTLMSTTDCTGVVTSAPTTPTPAIINSQSPTPAPTSIPVLTSPPQATNLTAAPFCNQQASLVQYSWSAASNATYYDVSWASETPVNVGNVTAYTVNPSCTTGPGGCSFNYSAGITWTVTACNSTGCSLAASGPYYTSSNCAAPTRTPTPTPTPKPLPTSTPSPLPTATLTPIPPTPIPTSSVLDQGDGLLGMYYANRNLSGLPLYRIDQDINFNWGWQGSPMAGIAGTNFSSRWSGFVAPLHSETYTFFATSDDGVRVWVNGVLIINGWYNHSSKTFTGNIFLYANQKYSLKVEYYQHQGYDLVNLKWSSPSTTKGVIPQSQLYTYN